MKTYPLSQLKICEEQVVASADKCVKNIPIISEQEKDHLIELGRGEELSYDRSETFVDLFKKQVALYPDLTAVVDEMSSITYTELDRKSDLLAHALVSSGVVADTFVAIMLPRRKEFIVSILAVFKSGGAYIPLDSDYPNDRLLYMLEDSQAKVLITTRELFNEKQKEGDFSTDNIIFIDELDFSIDNKPINNSHPRSLAYMIYTSGSTGKPKGVMMEHKGLRSFVEWRLHTTDAKPTEAFVQYISFSFCGSLDCMMTPLGAGAEVHIVSSSLRRDMDGLYNYFKQHSIVGGTFGTQVGMELLNQYDLSLRFLVVGSDKLISSPPPSNVQVVNAYGCSECVLFTSYHIVDPYQPYTNIPIGRPVPNTLLVIVDPSGNLISRGMEGELCVISVQVARGYWNREELTAEKFADCPFLEGEKMYRTGDLARWNEDGELEYLGRIDNQVKLRGFRIELGEIEVAMSRYTGIQKTVVDMKTIANVDHLCGYYTSNEAIDEEKLREQLAASLIDYMVPTVFMRLEALPLTPNGKVNRKALPMPEIKAEEIIVPETAIEQSLFEIAAKLLNNNSFGVTTNLISMGLTSMGAIKLSLVVQRELGLSLHAKDILKTPVIRKWVKLVDTEQDEIKVYERRNYYPLTENQLGVYIDWEQHRDGLQYNVPMAMKLTGVDSDQIHHSLEKVLEAHPYLKTRLGVIDGEVVQLRRDEEAINILFETLNSEPDAAFFQSRLREFNLLEDDLYRIEIYKSPEHTYLFIDIHHIICDGGSVNILLNDLQQAYNRNEISKEIFTAYDYSLYYADWKESEAFNQTEVYFNKLVDGAESILYPGASVTDSGSKVLDISIPRQSITELCRKIGVTENCFFTTALMQILHRITREDNILITTVSNGRASAKTAEAMGMFVQTLPVVSHRKNQSISECLSLMQEQLLETISHDKYPFTRLVEQHKVKPNILFAYQGEVIDEKLRFGVQDVENIALHLNTTKVPLSLNVTPSDDAYILTFEYDGSMYSHTDIQQLGEAFESFVATLSVSDLQNDIATVPLVSQSQSQELIYLGRGEEFSYDSSETFVDLFRKQVALHPDSIAVVDEVSSITYSELDRKSDLLASVLVASGVKTDSFVAVMLPRRKEFLVSVLGVFKSGGAYIPLDSEYPNDRLLYMLEDSAAKVLITTRELFNEKQKYGDFSAENIIFIDEFDFNDNCEAINLSQPESLAYMIYTSGSTGKPKGVIVEHKGLRSFVEWLSSILKLKHSDQCAEHVSFSFDGSLNDLMPPLTVGATVHILSLSLRHNMEGIHQYFKQNNIKGLTFSTQFGMTMLDSYDLTLDYLLIGGEKLQQFRPSNVKVINVYGPTEFTVISSIHVVDQSREYANIPIGRAVPNTISAVVDVVGNLVPRGVTGELCLIGRQIARGYWNRPELTTERFVDCPFIKREKMYRTGDLARWNEDGELECLGRIDNQVKLRGFRIELGEIESAISKYEGIQSSVVEVKEIGGTQHLCGYYTSTGDVNEDSLREQLAASLTEYMIPTAFMRLEALPMTPNGKVNRKALPMPEIIAKDVVLPETELEQSLFNIVSELLGTKSFGVTTNLISMGLTSMSAIRLSFAVQQELALSLQVKYILQKPIIREWLNLIQPVWDNSKSYKRREHYPLTELQQQFYSAWEQHQECIQYNIPFMLKLSQVDAEQLYTSMQKVLEAHPFLKVRLEAKEGSIVQVRHDDAQTHILMEKVDSELKIEFLHSRIRPFNLLEDELYRIEIYASPDYTYLFMDIHHIIFDGASLTILLTDLKNAYDGCELLSESFTAYDYSLDYAKWLKTEECKQTKSYFREFTNGVTPALYPPSTPAIANEKAKHLIVSIPQTPIKNACKKLGVTENCFFITTLMQLLHRTTKEEHIFIETVSNGRYSTHLSSAVGLFVQSLPVVSHQKSQTIADAMSAMQNQLLTTFAHDMYTVPDLKTNIEFNYHGEMLDGSTLLWPIPSEELSIFLDTTKIPLSINVALSQNTYEFLLEYDGGLYTEEDMFGLGNELRTLLLAIATANSKQDITQI